MKYKNAIQRLGLSVLIPALLVASGCGDSDKVSPLMEKGEYAKAYELVKENPEKYSEFEDEIKFNLAREAFDAGNYEEALDYLKENKFDGATDLEKEAGLKKTDQDFLLAAANGLDARYKEYDDRISEFSKESHLAPIQKELEAIEEYYEKEFYDQELKQMAAEYIDGVRKQVKAFDNWDTDLARTSLDSYAGNGYRIDALQKLNAKYPLKVEYSTTKDTLKAYNKMIAEQGDAFQKSYESFKFTETRRYEDQVYYEFSGTNLSKKNKIEKEDGFDTVGIISFQILDRNGDIVGNLYDDGVVSLRPGQSFTIEAFADKPIGDLKDYYLE